MVFVWTYYCLYEYCLINLWNGDIYQHEQQSRQYCRAGGSVFRSIGEASCKIVTGRGVYLSMAVFVLYLSADPLNPAVSF